MRFGVLLSLLCGLAVPAVGQDVTCDLYQFLSIAKPRHGVTIVNLAEMFSPADVAKLKSEFPVSGSPQGALAVIYSSKMEGDVADYFKAYPAYLAFYKNNSVLQKLAERMREEILDTLPPEQRDLWAKKTWNVVANLQDGTQEARYDAVPHTHPYSLVGTMVLEGDGTIAKISRKDISGSTKQEIMDLANKNELPCWNYPAKPGELVILNSVHCPGGGLHAAPQSDGKYPARLFIAIGIDKG